MKTSHTTSDVFGFTFSLAATCMIFDTLTTEKSLYMAVLYARSKEQTVSVPGGSRKNPSRRRWLRKSSSVKVTRRPSSLPFGKMQRFCDKKNAGDVISERIPFHVKRLNKWLSMSLSTSVWRFVTVNLCCAYFFTVNAGSIRHAMNGSSTLALRSMSCAYRSLAAHG